MQQVLAQLTREFMMKEKQISRIIAFGDSQTYGYFLTEKNNGYGFGPSNLAWPAIVAEQYSIDSVNNGVCGASNKEIWLEAINFNYQEGDIVCILWSFFDRDFFPTGKIQNNILGFEGHFDGTKLIPNYFDNKKNTLYYKEFHSNFNSLASFSLYKSHIALYLESIDIPYIFRNLEVSNMSKTSFEWDKTICKGINYILDDYAFDNSHYGVKSHKTVATYFIEDINEQNIR
jgi:hypothetical protein